MDVHQWRRRRSDSRLVASQLARSGINCEPEPYLEEEEEEAKTANWKASYYANPTACYATR